MTGTLRVLIHLLGGQTMTTAVESALEPDEYAEDLRGKLERFGRGFYALGPLLFHTNAVAGVDVDTYV